MKNSKGIWKKAFVLTLVGGLAFWLANFAISRTAIAAEYRAAMSISYYPMLLESLIGGLIIGLWVSYPLLRFFDRIPAKDPILKSVILSSIVLVIVTILLGGPSSFYATNNVLRYFIIGTVFNVIRIPALGIAIGYVCKRQYRRNQIICSCSETCRVGIRKQPWKPRSQVKVKAQASREFSKKLLMLAAAGGAAFWITDFVIAVSPIAARIKPRSRFSSLPVALVEALAGGLVIALCVSFFLLRFFDRIPGKNPILKALILSFCVMVIIEVLSALGNPSHASVYLLLDTGMNAPRFLALGLVIGYLFDKQKRKGIKYESNYLPQIRFTGCSSAPGGGETSSARG